MMRLLLLVRAEFAKQETKDAHSSRNNLRVRGMTHEAAHDLTAFGSNVAVGILYHGTGAV